MRALEDAKAQLIIEHKEKSDEKGDLKKELQEKNATINKMEKGMKHLKK
jgi:hypothetical protein